MVYIICMLLEAAWIKQCSCSCIQLRTTSHQAKQAVPRTLKKRLPITNAKTAVFSHRTTRPSLHTTDGGTRAVLPARTRRNSEHLQLASMHTLHLRADAQDSLLTVFTGIFLALSHCYDSKYRPPALSRLIRSCTGSC